MHIHTLTHTHTHTHTHTLTQHTQMYLAIIFLRQSIPKYTILLYQVIFEILVLFSKRIIIIRIENFIYYLLCPVKQLLT